MRVELRSVLATKGRSLARIALVVGAATTPVAVRAADGEPPSLPPPRYHVPVEPALEPYATYVVATARVQVDQDLMVDVGYRLPPEVDGETQRPIVLKGRLASADARTVAVVGEKASGVCTLRSDGSASCETHYVDLALDLDGADAYVDSCYHDATTAAGYKAVAQQLQHQAIGVLEVARVLHVAP